MYHLLRNIRDPLESKGVEERIGRMAVDEE
jgi:hypothetical protein